MQNLRVQARKGALRVRFVITGGTGEPSVTLRTKRKGKTPAVALGKLAFEVPADGRVDLTRTLPERLRKRLARAGKVTVAATFSFGVTRTAPLKR